MNWYWIGEPILYSCLAILFGGIIVPRIHTQVKFPAKLLIIAAVGVAIFSFLPVLRIVLFFSDDAGFALIFKNVMLFFSEGKAYIWTVIFTGLFISIVLVNNGVNNRGTNKTALTGLFLLAIGIIGTLSWSSHASSNFGIIGFWTQFLHLLSVSVWAGILVVAGMFIPSKTDEWKVFLRWYHPLAIIAMVIILVSGLLLNMRTDPDYVNSWITSYGQSLLLKHLFVIPLLVIAFFNGFLVKRKLNHTDFNPKKWVLVEGIIILLIYTVTGYMNQQPAPHDLNPQLMESSASKLYMWLIQGKGVRVPVEMTWSPISVFLFIVALCSIVSMYLLFKKNKNAYAALICAFIFTFVSFVGFMTLIS
ncbi:hypothetical protein AK95_25615 [Paenibacillus sp. LC231]|jgi:putative copper resistance protein D|uniref:Copper resistance protein D domain-containing protein n=2 Tax=Paenibacillus TaxID=44249 RepID=A0A385U0K3_PAELA|nr:MULTISPECIES: CopD family protein [Paenibacillus]AYB48167.1 hypothetical protein D5F53_33165 [Paenibacillus lautus]MBX4152496.1 CopD family protein [Paenibacillus lautus]OIB00557.1 hypothetical protein AK95_25615 [Paenibacillus sp. LC231]VTR35864.1 Putative copper export protein [Actinobacillus pleuropneumoniae]